MRLHYGTLMIYKRTNSKRSTARWWKTACKRKTLSPNMWTVPDDITMHVNRVTCEKCLENMGLELLQEL